MGQFEQQLTAKGGRGGGGVVVVVVALGNYRLSSPKPRIKPRARHFKLGGWVWVKRLCYSIGGWEQAIYRHGLSEVGPTKGGAFF